MLPDLSMTRKEDTLVVEDIMTRSLACARESHECFVRISELVQGGSTLPGHNGKIRLNLARIRRSFVRFSCKKQALSQTG